MECDLAPHTHVGLVLQVGHAESFPRVLRLESRDPCLPISKQCRCLTAIEKDGDGKRLVQPELTCEADGVPLLYTF